MRSLRVILLAAFISLLLFGCYHGKHRPIDVYLTVESDYGSPNPPVGENYLNYGITITASVDSPVAGGTGTRYVCAGWTGTGSVPASGSTTSVTFTITTNTRIIWNWQTQHYLALVSLYGEPQGEGWYNEGTTATWSVTSPWQGEPGIRYVADPASGSVVMDAPKTVTVSWTTQYQLTTSILPEGGGSIICLPEGPWYDADTSVQLTAVPNPAYTFTEWSGDLTGTTNPQNLTMNAPKSVTAYFTTKPFVIYVDGANGDDANSGLRWATAVKTIQTGLDKAANGWTVLVANGTYTGTGNRDLNFNSKAMHLKSVGGAANCIIDCENSGRGFIFYSGETNNAIVQGFTIQNGSANGGGGGVWCWYSSSPTFTNCIISGNSAYWGGGVACDSSSPTFTNCIISGNSAAWDGGGVCCYSSSPTFTNCAILGNSAYNGGGIYCSSSTPTFRNSIIWGNTATSSGNQIYTYDSSSSVTLSYSCYANSANDVAGAGQVNPDNCINTNPLFVGGGNYHLQATSPCIDAGSNSLVPAGITTDLDGYARIVDGDGDTIDEVDMGAYEYQP